MRRGGAAVARRNAGSLLFGRHPEIAGQWRLDGIAFLPDGRRRLLHPRRISARAGRGGLRLRPIALAPGWRRHPPWHLEVACRQLPEAKS